MKRKPEAQTSEAQHHFQSVSKSTALIETVPASVSQHSWSLCSVLMSDSVCARVGVAASPF